MNSTPIKAKAFAWLLMGLLSLGGFVGHSQKHDYVWLSGYGGYPNPILRPLGYYLGSTIMDFKSEPVQIRLDSLKMNFSRTNTSYCDSNGNLLFYTNGIYVANALDEKIENSDSLNWGYFVSTWDTSIYRRGYRTPQGIVALQSSANPNEFYLIHSQTDSLGLTGYLYTKRVLTTLLDMSENNGHGKVIYKNKPLIEDNLGDELIATRHANGRDWWLLVHKHYTNCYYRILFDPTGAKVLPELTCKGDTVNYPNYGAASFSPDGSRYSAFFITSGLHIYDFDRCAGTLNERVYIPMDMTDSVWLASGLSFSPNGRFLYLSITKRLLQYDMWAADIPASVDTVGIYDGFKLPFGSIFYTSQLAPDGKIYMSCGNSEAVYHVINKPDEKGSACDFQQHGSILPSTSLGVPYFPNYRLGRLVGSECDTIWGSIDEETISQREAVLKVFPNPAIDIVTVDYGFTDWSKPGEVKIEIVNELGQIMHQQSLPHYSGFQKLNVASYPSGIYTTYIKRNKQVIAASKFAKQ